MAYIGIDLGTTNSLVAQYENDEPKILTNRFGDNITPSVVSILEDGKVLVGKTAKEREIKEHGSTFSAFKRHMGSLKEYRYQQTTYTPPELSALVLKSIHSDTVEKIGKDMKAIAVSVPAYFTDLQRKATLQSAALAGFDVIGLINEPTAAALAYHIHEREGEKLVAIIDLGGGTFDVSILDIFDSIVEVKAIAGDNYLGGEDFDLAIVDYIAKTYHINRYQLSGKDHNHLKAVAENIKRHFDRNSFYEGSMHLEDRSYDLSISQTQFNKICEPLLERIKAPIKKALLDSDIEFGDIDEVILVGGSTKMPIVKNHIGKLFGRLPLCHLNPDEVVALGASVYAGLRANNVELADTVMTDVCPYTLGVGIHDSSNEMSMGNDLVFSPIIERNVTVPTSKSQMYTPHSDRQTKVTIPVYQGESHYVRNNIHLGDLEMSWSKNLKHVRFDVRFTYDRNGILEVIVRNLTAGDEVKAILLNNNNLSEDDIEASLEKLANIKVHPKEVESNLYLLSKAERFYEMTTGELREQIGYEIQRFNKGLMTQDSRQIEEAVGRMEAFLSELERML